MTPATDFDVVIVGAGPAGATAAVSALRARPDLRVLLADKAAFPRDKPCGDGLGPGVVSILRLLDLERIVEGETPVDTCTVFGPKGSGFTSTLPAIRGEAVLGYVIPRVEFDARLVEEAVAAGADLRQGWRFAGLTDPTSSEITVTFETDEGIRSVTTRAVVGADGANSRVRAALGVRRNSDRLTGIAIRAYSEAVVPPSDRTLIFEWSEELLPAYAWYFPMSSPTVNIGLGLVVRDAKKRGVKLDRALGQFRQVLARRGITLGEPVSSRTYLLPHGARLPRLAHGAAILIGDAGSMINPLSGEGIFYGMAAGYDVGRALAAAHDPSAVAGGLRRVEQAFRKRFAWHYRSNFVASLLLRSRWWTRIVFRAAARDAEVLRAGVELLFGEGVLKVSTAARIIWGGRPG